jgi:hypothetical protein
MAAPLLIGNVRGCVRAWRCVRVCVRACVRMFVCACVAIACLCLCMSTVLFAFLTMTSESVGKGRQVALTSTTIVMCKHLIFVLATSPGHSREPAGHARQEEST